MSGRVESLNTRTMFLQPPPPAARPRPWWQDNDRDRATLISANTNSTDVTEKQMAGGNRSGTMRDGTSPMNPNQSDIGQRRTEPKEGGQPGGQRQGSSTVPPSSTPKPSNHKKGAIIASASTSPGSGVGRSSLNKNGRAFQQQKQFRSLAISSPSSSSSSSSSSRLLPRSLEMGINMGQSIQLGLIFTQILATFIHYFLPTLATAILVLISMQSSITLNCVNPMLSAASA